MNDKQLEKRIAAAIASIIEVTNRTVSYRVNTIVETRFRKDPVERTEINIVIEPEKPKT